MTSKELRQKYLDFFKAKNHSIIPSASLIPENDPSVLFTTAGMHPLVPYLMGENHPGGKRVVSVQKCIRTGDIDEVGDAIHHTFFEMMGNWSFGDPSESDGIGRAGYFKNEAITWSHEFLTSPQWLGLDKDRLAVSVFAGDKDAPFDQEAHDAWLNLGLPEKRIARLGKENNWWPAGGKNTGPQGPDTEMFYWTGSSQAPEIFDADDSRWVEIWNDVFMQYNKTAEGAFIPLKQKNVDTGMGLERVTAIINGLNDNYKSDLFINIIQRIEKFSAQTYGRSESVTKAMRIIADHLKAATFIMGDERGVPPANTDQGYVVRRLIRRAIRYGREIGIRDGSAGLAAGESWTKEIAKIVAHDYQSWYPELKTNINKIVEQFKAEEAKFKKTLEQGLRKFEKITENLPDKIIGGKEAFDLFQTYGFPLEITRELAKEKSCSVDDAACLTELKKHQELSRTASAGKFKGGLADAGEQTKKLHTAAHLLLAALRTVLGDQVVQKGSNITAERLRFDFSYPEKMTAEQKQKVEALVNREIKEASPITCEEIGLAEAKKSGAHGTFDAKYGDRVKVYTMGNFSKEICGGPHVNNTGELGHFRIQKEESSSAGVRRIKATLEN